MASGGKGGSTSSSVQIPDWIKEPAQRNLARAEQAAQVGYMPWYGPDVAAATPQQLSAMQASNTAAQAFGLAPRGQAFDSGLPQAQEFAGGVRGYSSAPLFNQAVNELAAKNPGQMARYNSLYNGEYLTQNPSTAKSYGLLSAVTGGDSGTSSAANGWSGYGPSSTSYTGYSDALASGYNPDGSYNVAPVVNMGTDTGFGGYGGIGGTGASMTGADADVAYGSDNYGGYSGGYDGSAVGGGYSDGSNGSYW